MVLGQACLLVDFRKVNSSCSSRLFRCDVVSTSGAAEGEKLFYINVWIRGKDVMVAVCDADLLGRTFREGGLKLDVKESFYGGRLVSLEEALDILKGASIGNLVGRNIVANAIREGLIHEDAVLWIEDQPHAQFINII